MPVSANKIKVLATDKSVREGVMPNGLKCYVVTSPSQKGRADFALVQNTGLSAHEIAEKALHIAASICVFTNDNIIVELKAVNFVDKSHRRQLFNYMHLTHTEYGMLINFGGDSLFSEWYRRSPMTGEIDKIKLL